MKQNGINIYTGLGKGSWRIQAGLILVHHTLDIKKKKEFTSRRAHNTGSLSIRAADTTSFVSTILEFSLHFGRLSCCCLARRQRFTLEWSLGHAFRTGGISLTLFGGLDHAAFARGLGHTDHHTSRRLGLS